MLRACACRSSRHCGTVDKLPSEPTCRDRIRCRNGFPAILHSPRMGQVCCRQRESSQRPDDSRRVLWSKILHTLLETHRRIHVHHYGSSHGHTGHNGDDDSHTGHGFDRGDASTTRSRSRETVLRCRHIRNSSVTHRSDGVSWNSAPGSRSDEKIAVSAQPCLGTPQFEYPSLITVLATAS